MPLRTARLFALVVTAAAATAVPTVGVLHSSVALADESQTLKLLDQRAEKLEHAATALQQLSSQPAPKNLGPKDAEAWDRQSQQLHDMSERSFNWFHQLDAIRAKLKANGAKPKDAESLMADILVSSSKLRGQLEDSVPAANALKVRHVSALEAVAYEDNW